MKIITVVGARPQFIKAAVVSRAIAKNNIDAEHSVQEVIVHTGQHYDNNMSQIFFNDLNIPRPNYSLEVADCSHGAMTGRMLEKLEQVLLNECPQWVLVYGDTNSTLAGALAAAKLHIPVAHIEAGLRSYNMHMPEEINRILTDRISKLLFCPTETAVSNLNQEGIREGVYNVGDVMYDATLYYREKVRRERSLKPWGLEEQGYVLSTIHRAENTDDPARLRNILEGLNQIARFLSVVLPLHPRTWKVLEKRQETNLLRELQVIEPVSYLDMIRLEMSARAILTDSGGVQKEAFFHGVPCLTLRDETEWVETLKMGWNQLCGANKTRILAAWERLAGQTMSKPREQPYGDGYSAEHIISLLMNFLKA